MKSGLDKEAKELLQQIRELKNIFKVDDKAREAQQIEHQMSRPGFWENADAKNKISRMKALKALYTPLVEAEKEAEDLAVLAELAVQEEEEQSLQDATKELERLKLVLEKLQISTLLTGKDDFRPAFISIHAGAGGRESCDWAEMLMRMYLRYLEREDFEFSIADAIYAEEGGIKSATIHIKTPNAYGLLKAEMGVHRLVRISPYDANKRRHTSFASVDIISEYDDIEIQICDEDLKIDTFRSSGPGGQHVNVTDSAVRVTHIPSGIVVSCQSQRSQHSNRREAMSILRSRLHRREEQKRKEEVAKLHGEKGEIAFGNQIRSYTLHPYCLVKDHRTDVETSAVDDVLDGNLERFIIAYLKQSAAE
ncbi:MAG: peptide chain release factor 2 [Planctomycetota bacterium]